MDKNVSLQQTQLPALQGPMSVRGILQSFPVTSAPEREEPDWGSWWAPCTGRLEEYELKNGNVQGPQRALTRKRGS